MALFLRDKESPLSRLIDRVSQDPEYGGQFQTISEIISFNYPLRELLTVLYQLIDNQSLKNTVLDTIYSICLMDSDFCADVGRSPQPIFSALYSKDTIGLALEIFEVIAESLSDEDASKLIVNIYNLGNQAKEKMIDSIIRLKWMFYNIYAELSPRIDLFPITVVDDVCKHCNQHTNKVLTPEIVMPSLRFINAILSQPNTEAYSFIKKKSINIFSRLVLTVPFSVHIDDDRLKILILGTLSRFGTEFELTSITNMTRDYSFSFVSSLITIERTSNKDLLRLIESIKDQFHVHTVNN